MTKPQELIIKPTFGRREKAIAEMKTSGTRNWVFMDRCFTWCKILFSFQIRHMFGILQHIKWKDNEKSWNHNFAYTFSEASEIIDLFKKKMSKSNISFILFFFWKKRNIDSTKTVRVFKKMNSLRCDVNQFSFAMKYRFKYFWKKLIGAPKFQKFVDENVWSTF